MTVPVFPQEPTPASDVPEQRAVPAAWTGDSGVVIAVTDDAGSPVPGVTVEMRLEEQSGGFAVQTSGDGRVTIEGLAAGEWQVDLRREGFMLITAYLRLDAGKDPELGFSSRQRTGTNWAPLNAVFLPTDVPVTSAAATGRRSPKATRRDIQRTRKQARKEEGRAERRQRRGQLARVVEEPAPPREAAAKPAPATEQAQNTPTADDDGATDERRVASPSRDQPPTRDDAAAATARPTTLAPATAEAEPPPAPEPEPVVESPAAPVGPRLLPNPNLLPAGACPECRPGEWSVSVQVTAAVRDGELPCDASVSAPVADLAESVGAALDERTSAFAGALAASDENDLVRLFAADTSADLGRRLRRLARTSSCLPVAVVIPAGAKYIGFRYQAGERRFMGECPPDQECQISEARWLGAPEIVETESVTIVHGVFENLHRRREREPRLTVYFVPPRGWLPPG